MNRFIQLLDRKREENARYDYTKRRRQDRLHCMPSELQFSTLLQGVPIDYYDPDFSNRLQPQLCSKITNKSIALLPDIEQTFTHGQDERLGDKAFMHKYGEEVLARYKLDDLSDVESEEISVDEEDLNEMEL